MACFIDEDSNCPIAFDIVDETIGKIVYWHIPNVLSLPSSVDYGVNSPQFTFANATWCLQMYPHGQRMLESENFIDLHAVRRESLVEKHEVEITLDLEIAPTAEFPDFALKDDRSLPEDDLSSDSDTDCVIFESNRSVYSTRFMEYASIVSDEDFVPPHDGLVAYCKLIKFGSAYDVQKSVGPSNEDFTDHQWFSIGDSGENPTIGMIKDFEIKRIKWSIPCFLRNLQHAELQSPRFIHADVTWCLRFRYYKVDETAQLAIVWLHSLKRRSQQLTFYCEVKAHFHKSKMRTKIKKLKKALQKTVVGRNNSEHEILTFRCSKTAFESCTLDVTCLFESHETAVGSLQSVPEASEVESVHKLLCDLKRLLLTSDGSDVTLLVKGQAFPAHSAILRSRSSVFNSMLGCDMKEKRTGEVDIEDCDPGTFPDFLQFLYCGSVENLSSENVFSLYRAADKYDVQDLKSQCVAFMESNLTDYTFCATLALSLQHDEKSLLKIATEFFGKNFQRIILTVQWQEFIVENPMQANELFVKALVTDGAFHK